MPTPEPTRKYRAHCPDRQCGYIAITRSTTAAYDALIDHGLAVHRIPDLPKAE